MFKLSVLCCLGVACEGAQSAAAVLMPSATCAAQAPPAEARRQSGHGADLLISPDLLVPDFTGCQKAWLEDGRLLGTVVYQRGEVQSFTSREPKGRAALRCDYTGKAAKPLPAKCPSRDEFPLWP